MSAIRRVNLSIPPGTRFRLAGLLLVLTAAILVSKLWEDFYVDSMRRDCGSLFRDRLMPATMLFHLSDDFHTRRHVLVEHLESRGADREPSIDYEMGRLDASIDRVIDEFETTYLVAEESKLLEALKQSLEQYRTLERALLDRARNGERVVYGEAIRAAFDEVGGELLSLTEIQQAVGQQLDRNSVASVTHMNTLIYFQLGIAFVLGLLASAIAMGLDPRRFATGPRPRRGRRTRTDPALATTGRRLHDTPPHRDDSAPQPPGRRFREPRDPFRNRSRED